MKMNEMLYADKNVVEGRKVEVIVKVATPSEHMLKRLKDKGEKTGLEVIIDKILEATEKCPSVKIVITDGA